MSQSPDMGALLGAAAERTSFLGLDACLDLGALIAPIAIIGAPCATPYRSVGAYCRNGPDALRRASRAVAASIDRYDFDIGGPIFPEPRLRAVDCGNLALVETDGPANRDAIRAAIGTILARGAVPILLGGDDSVPIPMLQALGTTGIGSAYTILQIDAHIDWRDTLMEERWGLSSTMRRASEMAHIARIIQVGARGTGSAGPQDHADAVAWGVSFVPAQELHRRGVQMVADLIPHGSEIVICVDVDALDPALVPGVIGRAPGGLFYYQMVELILAAASRGRIVAMNFVEFMPERDVDGIGALTVARLITTALGVLARQRASPA